MGSSVKGCTLKSESQNLHREVICVNDFLVQEAEYIKVVRI